jgi:hypothetical protein
MPAQNVSLNFRRASAIVGSPAPSLAPPPLAFVGLVDASSASSSSPPPRVSASFFAAARRLIASRRIASFSLPRRSRGRAARGRGGREAARERIRGDGLDAADAEAAVEARRTCMARARRLRGDDERAL